MSIISIKAIVDVVAVLSNNTLDKNLYLMDNNKLNGSNNEGTASLETAIQKGDELVWSTFGLEVESYVEINTIKVNKTYITEPVKSYYDGTNIPYWTATVLKAPTKKMGYTIDFNVGDTKTVFSITNGPSIKPIIKKK
ncbi:hypothetical protein [Tenacibaculum xiamenense]|uniref:hypothetical protein n=1 Tax=Tenacibaculum xiamenense TaxID=1261553 RepID=UPI00389467A9